MSTNTIYGILFAVIVVISVIIFIFNFSKGLLKFSKLEASGKAISIIIAVVTAVSIIVFSYFSYKQFTYTPPKTDALTEELNNTIKNAENDSTKYKQTITLEEYIDGDLDTLYNSYSKKGQADIDSTSNNSEKTKELILRNVGKKLEPGTNTVKLATIAGDQYSLIDGKNKLLVFADTSQYSIDQLELLYKYNQDNKEKLDYVTIFPMSTGSEVEEMYNKNSSKIGVMKDLNIVTKDSMPDKTQMDLIALATKEFSITDLPSYLAIDDNSVISNAGVGSIFKDSESLSSFISKAFSSKNKMYYEIIEKETKDSTTSTESTEQTTSTSEADE